MFATHQLFEKHYANLVNSFATEAITSGKEIAVPYEKVKQYLQSIIEDESKQGKGSRKERNHPERQKQEAPYFYILDNDLP